MNSMKKYLTGYEYKVLHKRIIFTCFILFIYILGSRIPVIFTTKDDSQLNHFYNLTAASTGGDFSTLNIFSLGIGPWLTAMVFMTLLSYKNQEKSMKQTRKEKHFKEKTLALILSVGQGYFVLNQFLNKEQINELNKLTILIILITGAMLLMWLADQNTRYGIAGPMPIVFISIIKAIFREAPQTLGFDSKFMIIIVMLFITLMILMLIELVEYRIKYIDIINVSKENVGTYLSWKINPAGSMSLMISISTFMILNSLVNIIFNMFRDRENQTLSILNFTNPLGITIYLLIQLILGYVLSRFLLNTKNKAEVFLKSGNYFENINPGNETSEYLNHKAQKLCWFGSLLLTIIIAIPLYSTLLVPGISQEVYIAIQLIVLVYIGLNITETIRTYLYFDKYSGLLKKYW